LRLFKAVIDAAQPRAKRHIIWDEQLPGFGLRIEPSGAKVFLVRYRGEGGGRNAPQRQATIGRYGVVTLAQASKKAEEILAAATLGGDPVGERNAKRREIRVTELIDRYEEEGCVVQRGLRQGEPMKPNTKAFTLARLRNHVVPLLGSRRASEITEGDIERLFRDVAAGKTAKDEKSGKKRGRLIVRGGDGAARKVVRDLSAVFSFAQRRRIVSANPVAKASVRKTDKRRERFLTLEEVQRLGRALDELGTEGARGLDKTGRPLPTTNAKALDITRLWLLTGCRRNEISSLEWRSVDLERGLLVFDDTKTGRSIRPLAAPAVFLLKDLQGRAEIGARYVFPAERGSGFFAGVKSIWPEVVRRACLPGVTPHMLRHTVGEQAVAQGESLLLVGSVLGHANARSTAIYAHVAHDPARLAADRATAGIAAALGFAGALTTG